ncbi:hypothetical protein GCM10008933_22210 [Paenibacillus motobuensis]|uniref:Uncharacterized protein n=1 Tax=Paenibacillus motobuensis TaxID=295324 RepID=A0ABN0YCC7_9BACL
MDHTKAEQGYLNHYDEEVHILTNMFLTEKATSIIGENRYFSRDRYSLGYNQREI